MSAVSSTITKLRQSALVRGGLVVGAGILAGNVTGFFRIAAQAYFLGTHARADALSVAIGPVDTLNTAIVNTMLVSFVPMLMLRPEEERASLFARAANVFFWLLVGGSLAVALLAPLLISLMGPGLALEQHNQAVLLLRLVAPATLFAGGSAIYAALLYTQRRFLVPALYQACLNGATIVFAIALWRVIGINGFAVGYTAGAFLQLALTWAVSRDLRKEVRRDRGVKVSLRELLIRPGMFLLYAALVAANILVTRAFATHAGPGMAAAFDYCLRCVSVVVAYMVYPVANSLLPEIARLRGAHQTAKAYRLIDKSVGLMAVASVASCGIGILLRTPAIKILFERGNFTSESTELVATVFLGFAPAIVGWALMDLISRCSFALDRPRLPLMAAFIPVTVNLLVMSILGRRHNPMLLGVGASIGLLAGFVWLFVAAHVRRTTSGSLPVRIPEADHEQSGEHIDNPASGTLNHRLTTR